MPKVRNFFTNISAPVPVGRKLRLLLWNNWLKLYTRRSCCGNHGQPGC